MKKMETFPSKVDPEISPIDQYPQITPDDNTPESFDVSLTKQEIDFLNELIRHERSSPLWYTEIHRIRILLQSIAHQVKINLKPYKRKISILDPDFNIDDLVEQCNKALDIEDEMIRNQQADQKNA